MPKTMKKSSAVWPKTKNQKKADKEILKKLQESYDAVSGITKKNANEINFNIAALWRKEQQLLKVIKSASDDIHRMEPDNIFFAERVQQLNATYWLWVGIKNTLVVLERGY